MGEVVNLREAPSDIAFLMQQTWPVNRKRGDFRDLIRAQADAEPRTVICAFCGTHSPSLDGPTGRAWFASHECPT
jgi:hypothetical protein